MDLTIETKQYRFTACYSFDYITIFLIHKLNATPCENSSYDLTKKEVRELIEYLKQNNYGDGRDFWIVDNLITMEGMMSHKDKAIFRFW